MQNQIGVNIDDTIRELTASVQDAPHKPYLRSTIGAALKSLEYETEEVESGLDRFYQPRRLQ